jgi:hypothetical protein
VQSLPIACPLEADIGGAVSLADLASVEAGNAGGRQEKRIFDSGPDPRHPLGEEGGEERSLLRVLRRREQRPKQQVDVVGVERTLGGLFQMPGDDRRIEGAPQQALRLRRIDRQVDDGGAVDECKLDHLPGSPAASRLQSIPQRQQQVAVRNRGPAGHHIGFELGARHAREFEYAGRLVDQAIETRPAVGVTQRGAIGATRKRQDGVQLEAGVERRFGSNLVGAVGKRRHELQDRGPVREDAGLACSDRLAAIDDQPQRFRDPRPQLRFIPGDRAIAMPGDTDAEHERRARRCRPGAWLGRRPRGVHQLSRPRLVSRG